MTISACGVCTVFEGGVHVVSVVPPPENASPEGEGSRGLRQRALCREPGSGDS